MEFSFHRATLILMSLLALQACVIRVNAGSHGGDISKVMGGIEIDSGSAVGDLDTVNGGILLRDASTAAHVETVNGGIKARDDVSARSLSTVNGGIRAGHNLKVTDEVSTVNGGIELGRGTVVGKDVSTVNGRIELSGTEVGGNVETVNGDIYVEDASVVLGDVVFEKDRGPGWWGKDEPTLIVDAESRIHGKIRLYREVRLRIHDDAKVGEIIEYY